MVSPTQRLLATALSRRRVLRGGALAGLGIAGAALVGCGSGEGTEAAADAQASTSTRTANTTGGPVEGGVAQISNGIEPTIWDPVISEAAPPATYAAPLYPHLFVTKVTEETDGNSFEFEQDLVESWEQPDDLTYVFTIHTNGKWGPAVGGRAITSEDVVYSLNRWRSEASVIRGNFEPVDTVEALDASTVKVTLKHPFSPLIAYLSDTSAAVSPPEVEATLAEQGTAHGVHGGPWLLETYEPGVKVVLRRNPDYYLAPLPYLDVVINIYPDAATSATAFESRQILTRGVSPSERDRLLAQFPELKTGSTGAAHQSLFFNTQREPWNDPRVRKAIRLAIDFDAYRQIRFPDSVSVLETPARAWLEPYALPQEELSALYQPDVEQAQRLLAEAGLEGGFDGGDLHAFPLGSSSVDLVLPVVERLKSTLNVTFDVQQIEYSAHAALFKNGEFNTGMFIYSRRYPEVDQYLYPHLHSTGALNYARGSDAHLDELLEQQRRETDVEARIAVLHELQRYFIEELNWFIVLPTNESHAVWWPELRDYKEHVSFGQYQLRRAWLEA